MFHSGVVRVAPRQVCGGFREGFGDAGCGSQENSAKSGREVRFRDMAQLYFVVEALHPKQTGSAVSGARPRSGDDRGRGPSERGSTGARWGLVVRAALGAPRGATAGGWRGP